MELSPEAKAQLEAQKKNCIFCKIVKGEMASKKVYEDDLLLAVLDINPCVKGHILILPKEHHPIMPHVPPKTFQRLFGILPELGKAVKTAMVSTGFNVFIANGGAAGQQSQHFMIHLFAREQGDQIWKYHFNENKTREGEELKQFNQTIQNNFPIMMRNHFGRTPNKWHTPESKGEMPAFLTPQKGTVYEDEKSLVILPEKSLCKGHLVVQSKEEEKQFDKLGEESASHLFYVASYASTAVFEGLRAHGSNIILKTGKSQDNEEGKLEIHILPRFGEDKVEVTPKPLTPKPDLGLIQERIKEETFLVEHKRKHPEREEQVLLEDPSQQGQFIEEKEELIPEPENEGLQEISAAIEFVKE